MSLVFALLLWRTGLFVVAAWSTDIYSFEPTFPYSQTLLIDSKLPQWVWAWGNFDGVHYLTIAQRGYFAQFTQAFFPLYPLVLRLFSFLTRDTFMILSGIILSFLSFVLGIILFKKLLKLDYKEPTIHYTTLFLLLFPTSFFFGALYTEALFFLLVMCSLWFARKRRWMLASLCAALASGMRITGVLLLPALLWEWFQAQSSAYLNSRTRNLSHKILAMLKQLFKSPIVYIAPLGLFIYMLYLYREFNDPLYFWHAQPVFGAARTGGDIIFPPQVVWRYLKILFTVSPVHYHFWTAMSEFGAFILSVALLLVAHKKRIRQSYLIFSWLLILVPTLTGTFSSLPRYVILAFPMFIVLGMIKNKYIQGLLLVTSGLLLCLYLVQFIRGWWIA